MFANEDEGLQESKKTMRKDDPMDVDALSRGSGKGKIQRNRQEGERPEPLVQRQMLELRQDGSLWP